MSRLALVLALVFLTALSAHAQSVSVLQEARLFAEPDERAEVKATLPAGVRLTVVAEQDGWLAVSTSTGVAGWVLRSLVSELDSTPAPRTTEPAPEPPPVETPEVQPERPTEVVEDPPQMEEAPPQQTEPSVVSREPVYRTRPPVEQGPGGFFDVKKWWGISVGFQGDAILPGAEYGMMINRMIGVTVFGQFGYEDSFGSTFYSAGGGARADVFILQPNDNLPLGVYAGGRASYQQTFNSDFESLGGVLGIGGEAGAYAHFGEKVLLIPRAGVRVVNSSVYVNGNKFGDSTDTSLVLGLDVNIGSFIPGFFALIYDGGEMFGGSLLVPM